MQGYDVSRDGARFLVGKAPGDVSPSPLTVLLGWSRSQINDDVKTS
jgi:hypothetical protein